MEIIFWLISLAVGLAFAYLCHKIAVGKGRGPVLWAVLGFLFTLITLVVILLIPRKDPPATANAPG